MSAMLAVPDAARHFLQFQAEVRSWNLSFRKKRLLLSKSAISPLISTKLPSGRRPFADIRYSCLYQNYKGNAEEEEAQAHQSC
jgi:hypothetical protein